MISYLSASPTFLPPLPRRFLALHAHFLVCLKSIQKNYIGGIFAAPHSCYSLPLRLSKDGLLSMSRFNSNVTSSGDLLGLSLWPSRSRRQPTLPGRYKGSLRFLFTALYLKQATGIWLVVGTQNIG